MKRQNVLELLVVVLMAVFVPRMSPAQSEEEELREDPAGRERFRHMQRQDERGEIAFGALASAKTQMNLRRAKGTNRIPDDAGIWNWEWLGPGTIGGRIRSILIHPTSPNTMWIGSVSGGIWRTDNGGVSWSPVNDFMADLAVTSIVMVPTNPNIMYASTGEGFIDVGIRQANATANPGAGIFKSIDGGVTWNQLASTDNSGFMYVNRIAHHPSQSNTLIAVTNGGIQRTMDGGLTWEILNGTSIGTDVKYNPSNPNMVAVGTYNDLVLSTDGGSHFSRQTTGATDKMPDTAGRCEVAFAPTNPTTLYALINKNGGQLWRSTNGGVKWEKRYSVSIGETILEAQGQYANALAVSPVDENFVIAGGLNLWRSTNGGTTFDRMSYWPCYPACVNVISHSAHADQHTVVFPPGFDGSTNKTVYVGNDGGIQMTTDVTTVGGRAVGRRLGFACARSGYHAVLWRSGISRRRPHPRRLAG